MLPFSIQTLSATDIDLSIDFRHAAGISQPGIESGSSANSNNEAPASAEVLPLLTVSLALTGTTPPQLQREVNQHMQRA